MASADQLRPAFEAYVAAVGAADAGGLTAISTPTAGCTNQLAVSPSWGPAGLEQATNGLRPVDKISTH